MSLSQTDNPEQNPPAVDVIHVLIKTNHHFNRVFEQRLSALKLPIALSGPRLRVLSMVWKMGGIRMSQLADKLGVRARTVTDLVDALERDGLINRLPDPDDRRATILKLTDKAENHLEPVRALQSELAEQMLSGFSADQRCQLLDLLERMTSGLESQ